MWSAVWAALMTFFSHLKTQKRIEETGRKTAEQITEATRKAKQDAQTTEAERHKADEKTRGATPDVVDAKLSKWMRD